MHLTARARFIGILTALVAAMPSARAEVTRHDVLLIVTTALRGANVQTTRDAISQPLENVLRDLPGLQVVISISRAGESTIYVKLRTPEGADATLAAARAKVGALKPSLPSATEGPRIDLWETRTTPVAFITLASDTLTAAALSSIGRRNLVEVLKTIPDVAAVKEHGLRFEMVVAALDPAKLAAYGLTRAGVEDLLRQRTGFSIEAVGPNDLAIYEPHAILPQPEAVSQIVLTMISGAPLRLRDVAQVERRMRAPEDDVRVNGRPAFLAEVYMSERMALAEATVQFRDSVQAALRNLPAGLDIRLVYACAACAERRR